MGFERWINRVAKHCNCTVIELLTMRSTREWREYYAYRSPKEMSDLVIEKQDAHDYNSDCYFEELGIRAR